MDMPMERKREAKSKYRVLNNILKKKTYQFALVHPGGLRQKCKDGYVDSETKRIIDAGIKEVNVILDDKRKRRTTANYANSKGCNLKHIHNLKEDLRSGVVFINGTSPREQSQLFMYALKRKNLDSTVVMVLYDWLCSESPLDERGKAEVAVTLYGTDTSTIRATMKIFREYIKCKLQFKEYTESPPRKFLVVIDGDACYTCNKRYDCWSNRY